MRAPTGPVKRGAIVALLAIVASGSSIASTATTRSGTWDAAALKIVDQLVKKLHAAGKTCSDYAPWDRALLTADLVRKHLPIPRAVASCTGNASEDLTFEVFADQAEAARFVAAKSKLLCEVSARSKLDYPGFPYVDGGTWLLEPDEQGTADALAPILGGTSKRAACH